MTPPLTEEEIARIKQGLSRIGASVTHNAILADFAKVLGAYQQSQSRPKAARERVEELEGALKGGKGN